MLWYKGAKRKTLYERKSALLYFPVGSIVSPAELHSPSAEENCLTENAALLRSVSKWLRPPYAAKAAARCGPAAASCFEKSLVRQV